MYKIIPIIANAIPIINGVSNASPTKWSNKNPIAPPGIVASTKYQNIFPSVVFSFFTTKLNPPLNNCNQSLKKNIPIASNVPKCRATSNPANAVTNSSDLVTDSLGYKTRLITYNDIETAADLEIVPDPTRTIYRISNNEDWLYGENYSYWTMTSSADLISRVGAVYSGGIINPDYPVTALDNTVRPVITISKDAL